MWGRGASGLGAMGDGAQPERMRAVRDEQGSAYLEVRLLVRRKLAAIFGARQVDAQIWDAQ